MLDVRVSKSEPVYEAHDVDTVGRLRTELSCLTDAVVIVDKYGEALSFQVLCGTDGKVVVELL